MNAKIPFDAADAGDDCGKMLVEHYIGYLADGITDLANIFRPDIIVLGGGVCAQGENSPNHSTNFCKKTVLAVKLPMFLRW